MLNRRRFTKLAALLSAVRGSAQNPACATGPANEVMSPDNASFRVNLDDLLNPHDMLWEDHLPGDWMQGAPLGNGDFGAMIHGPPDNLAFVLAKTDVWDRRNDDRSYFPGKNFAELRQTYFDRDEPGYRRLVTEAAKERRQHTLALPHLTTCGRLVLRLDSGLKHGRPEMRVRLRDGMYQLRYLDRSVRALVSREYHVLLIDIDRGRPETPPEAPLANRYGTRDPLDELPWELHRPPSEGNPRAIGQTDREISYLTQTFRSGGGYVIGVAFSGMDTAEATPLAGRLTGTLKNPPSNRVQVFLTIVSSDDAKDMIGECRRRLDNAVAAGAHRIIASHRAWWSSYWMRGLASVADRGVERWYYTSLYLCGSMLDPGRQSPGLQGVWCAEDFPRWGADYHSNGNIQAVYGGLAANNRLNLMEPYLRHYNRTAAVARKVARDYFRMRGLRYPLMGSPNGHDLNAPGMLGVDPCPTAWIVQLFLKYVEYSGDLLFLRETAYPLLRDAALFLVDYLQTDASGKKTMEPVLHFEARTRSFEKLYRASSAFDMWGRNSLYAQAMFRMGIGNAIRGAELLGVDAELRVEWKKALRQLVPPPATPDGYWKAWEDHDAVYGWHNFLLPLVFPGELVSRFHGPQVWLEQARATWRHLKRSGREAMTGRAWCGGQGICELLGIGELSDAFQAARWPGSQQTNGLTVIPETPVLQADHGPGMCRVLPDMLIECREGVIHVFQGLPRNMPARFLSLRAPGGFLLAGERRGNGAPDYLLVRATASKRLRLSNPWPGPATVSDAVTKKEIFTSSASVLEMTCEFGKEYRIAAHGRNLDPTPVENFAFSHSTQGS